MTTPDTINTPIAFLFPGQGSQFVGMADPWSSSSQAAREVLSQANDLLDFDLTGLMAHGPAEDLADTYNAQPAILTVSIAALAALRETGKMVDPTAVAGHSLGEFSALVMAGVIDFPTALLLVRERGRLMKEAGTTNPGGMAAVLGLDDEAIDSVCQEAGTTGTIVPANRNCPGQIVISGEIDALEHAMQLATAAGARRVARLDVSIASHSPLMSEANAKFNAAVDSITLREPAIPVIGNVTATPLTTSGEIRDELQNQMERPVDWTASIEQTRDAGVASYLEFAPGTVLSGLVKRIDRGAQILALENLDLSLPVQKRV